LFGKNFPPARPIIPRTGKKLHAGSNNQKHSGNPPEMLRRNQTTIFAFAEMAQLLLGPL
jgi:hypothetical protein